MAKHARIRRERAEREAAAQEEKERGPISEKDAVIRARIRGRAGSGSGTFAFGSRLRRIIKQNASFNDKRPKKRRMKKRGRR